MVVSTTVAGVTTKVRRNATNTASRTPRRRTTPDATQTVRADPPSASASLISTRRTCGMARAMRLAPRAHSSPMMRRGRIGLMCGYSRPSDSHSVYLLSVMSTLR